MKKKHGFTLIELMIVVVIIGVLSMVAIPGLRSYIMKARAAEAPAFLAEIQHRQETYRSTYWVYADCRNDWFPRSSGAVTPAKVAFTPASAPACWRDLAAYPDGPARFAYIFEGGGPGNIGPLGQAAGATGTDFYYVAQAVGDLDGDGVKLTVEGYSNRANVYISSPNGWE